MSAEPYEISDEEFDEAMLARLGIEHAYVSTACQHVLHALCRLECKYCKRPCRCECHPPAVRKGDDWSIDELDLTVRSSNLLARHAIQTIGDLRKWVDREDDRFLPDLKGLGQGSFDEITTTLDTWDRAMRDAL